MSDEVEILTIITVTTIGKDGQCSSACTYLGEEDDLNEEIENMKTESLEGFESEICDQAYLQLVHVDKLPVPKLPSVTISSDLPERNEGEQHTIETKIS